MAKYLPTLDFTKELIPQTGTPTFCKKLTKEDGFIDWNEMINDKCKMINFNKYRAYSPWPGIWTINNGKRMKILKCHLEDKKLVLDEIQFEGQKPQRINA